MKHQMRKTVRKSNSFSTKSMRKGCELKMVSDRFEPNVE